MKFRVAEIFRDVKESRPSEADIIKWQKELFSLKSTGYYAGSDAEDGEDDDDEGDDEEGDMEI